MNEIFSKYADYYDALYKDKNYNDESRYIERLINKFAGKKLNILELGCGSGSHAFRLQAKGHNIVAIDRSKKMINLAKKKDKNNKIEFLTRDLTKFVSKKKFDVIILLFHVINFLKSKNDLKMFSKNSFKNLKKNGIIIFDFINYDGVVLDKPQKKIKIVNQKNLKIIRETTPQLIKNKNILNINFKMTIKKKNNVLDRFRETHQLKLHSVLYLKKILNPNFKLIDIFKWMKFENLLKKDWFGLMVMKKN
jgi:2-polyprenyl-3-methyl-5-hydroxy-6-metoxy-1,4-benzoquinol methylase